MGWALPIDQWAIEPLHDGDPTNQAPAAFGIYRRNRHGWHRVTQKPTRELAEIKTRQLQERLTDVQISSTT